MNNKAKALEDLRKARFYLDDEIKRLEREAVKEDRELCRKHIQSYVIPFSDIVSASRILRELLNSDGKAESQKGGR